MKEIDKTKKNIRISEMDENQKKDLFKKFKNAGGQVLSEKEKRKNLIIDRDKQKIHQQRLDAHYSNKRVPITKNNVTVKNIPLKISPVSSSPFHRLRIRMRLRLFGISGFNTDFFKRSFFKKFNDYYKPSLVELQMIFLALFKKDPKTGNRIIRSLDKISPIYYELIENSSDLYKPYLIEQILQGYESFPDVPQSLLEIREFVTELFRALFILKPYENSIYNAFERSIDMSISFNEGKKDKNIRKKDLKNSLFIIFNKLYPRLHTLFCYYNGILFTESDKAIEDLLSIYQTEKPGNRVINDDSKSSSIITTVEDEEILKPEVEAIPDNFNETDAVKEGLKSMYKLDNKILRSLYDKKGEFERLNNSDKVLLTYMLFLEFVKEYSFILTTNKIKYNIDFSTNIKIDYRSKMQDIFNQLNKCQEPFKSYYETYNEYNMIFNQKPISNTQYISYSKRLDEVLKKKNQAGSLSRTVIKSFMDNLASELNILIEDMNSSQKFIANPQDILEFSYDIEGDKKLKNKKVYEAIEAVYNYASALSYRLSVHGDLYGKLEFDDTENKIEEENKNATEKKTSKTEESIFDELDDIL